MLILELCISTNNQNHDIKNVRGYPVYIVNSTDSNIVVNNMGYNLKIIQEAKDSNNKWRPIEHFDFLNCDFCFNTPFILEPKHYIVTKIYKYTGNYRTMVRLKFRNGNTIVYSNPFYGNINIEQFEFFKNPTKEQLIELYLSEETKQ